MNSEVFKINDGLSEVKVVLVPGFEETVTIIDDFYQFPDQLEQCARQQIYADFPTSENTRFPGQVCLTETTPSIYDFLTSKTAIANPTIKSKFQIQPSSREPEGRIHFDGMGDVALVYMGKDCDGRRGTSFYRHKETGLFMYEASHLTGVSLNSGYSVHSILEIAHEDRHNLNKWESLIDVKYMFNRAVLYPGRLYHNGSFWGTSILDSRLVHAHVILGRQ